LPVSVAEILQAFVARADQVILSAFIAASDFAFYAIGCLVVPPLYIIEQSVTRVLIPQLSDAFANRRGKDAAALYAKAVDQIGFIVIPAVAGMVVFAHPIIRLLFTERYASAAGYLTVFAFTYLFFMIPYDAVPRACGQAGWILKFCATFSVMSLGCAAGLTLAFGPYGALAALLLTRTGMTIYSINYMRHQHNWMLRELLPLDALRHYAFISLALSLASLLLQPLFSSELAWFLVCGVLFGVLYFVLLSVWKIELRPPARPVVLMISQSLYIGGLERTILALSKSLLVNESFLPRVFAFDHTEGGRFPTLTGQFKEAGVPTELYQKAKRFSFMVLFKLLHNIASGDVHIVHTHELGGLIYASFTKWLAFRRFVLVHTQHSFVHLQKLKRYRFYEKLFTSMVDELVVVSPAMRDAYIDLGFDPNKIHLIENGIIFPDSPVQDRAERIQARHELLSELADRGLDQKIGHYLQDYWLLYLARIHPVKGQRHAIKL
jgi:hypothetical protein